MKDANIKSAKRVFEIVEFFGTKRTPLRLKTIASELAYPTSSVAALLKCMTQLGYLDFDSATHCYTLTSRLADATRWAGSGDFESGIVDDVMRRLQRECGELVLLSVELGLYTEYVRSYRSTGNGTQLYLAPGTRRLLVQSGSGWLFLRNRTDSEISDIHQRTIGAGLLSEAELPLATLLNAVRAIKHDDVTITSARDTIGPVAHWGGGLIAMLLPVPEGCRQLVVCLAGPFERLSARHEELAGLLRYSRDGMRAVMADSLPPSPGWSAVST